MILLFLIVFIFVTFTCGFSETDRIPLEAIQVKTKINVTNEMIEGRDWNGDGVIYQEYELTRDELDSVKKDIEESTLWKKEPITEDIKSLVSKAEFLLDDEIKMLNVNNGYYFFKDRHSDATGDLYECNLEKIYSRSADNYTVAALDIENSVLYYFQLDT